MATSSPRLAFFPLISIQNFLKLLFSILKSQTKSIRILCFSSSPHLSATALETLAPPPPSQSFSNTKWEPHRKKKVVMRVGYVSTDYRGLLMQKDDSISSL